MRRKVGIPAGAALFTSLLGCAGDPVVSRVEVTDSAGVPIYALQHLPPWTDSTYMWELDLERSIPTGAPSPSSDPLLYDPQAYARLDDGTLVVLDGGALRLAIIDPDSNVVRSRFGPSGNGPGEILSQNAVVWAADASSFWLMDPGNRRLSRFGTDGEILEERTIDYPGMGGLVIQDPVERVPWFWRVFADGPDRQVLVDSVGRLDLGRSGAVYVAALPERPEERRSPRSPISLSSPMSYFAPLGRSGVVTGRTDMGRFSHFSEAGDLVGLIDVPMERAPIAETEKDEIVEEFRDALRDTRPSVTARNVGNWRALYGLMWGVSDSLFALQQTNRARSAGEPPVPENQTIWRVFSVTGHYEGAIVFPRGDGYPFAVEPGRLITTHRDELGVATINIYRSRR